MSSTDSPARQPTNLHKCRCCSRVFARSNNLVAHMRTHTGEKPFKCDECGATFAKKSNLVPHLRTHSGEKPYPCSTCGKRFNSSSHRNEHMALHRRAEPSPQVPPAPPTNARSAKRQPLVAKQPGHLSPGGGQLPASRPEGGTQSGSNQKDSSLRPQTEAGPTSVEQQPCANLRLEPEPELGPQHPMGQGPSNGMTPPYIRLPPSGQFPPHFQIRNARPQMIGPPPSRGLPRQMSEEDLVPAPILKQGGTATDQNEIDYRQQQPMVSLPVSLAQQPLVGAPTPPPPSLTLAPNAWIPEGVLTEAMERPFEEEHVRERPAATSSQLMRTSPNVQMEIRHLEVTPLVGNVLEGGANNVLEPVEETSSSALCSLCSMCVCRRMPSKKVEPVNVPPVVDTSPPEVKKKKNQPSSGLIRPTSPELSHSKSVDKIKMANKGKKRPRWTPSLANQKSEENQPIPSTSQKSKDETPISTPSISQSVHPTSSRVAKRKNLDSHKPDEERPWSKLRTTECKTCLEDKDSEFLKCKGYCKGTFHAVCQPILRTEEQCIYCLGFDMLCFICKSADDLNKCIQIGCKKYYHVDCLRSWPQTKHIGENLICPFHVCHTCWREDSDTIPPNDQLQKCMSCPTSYHKGDDCLAAGSETFGSNTSTGIWCPKHLLDVEFGLEHTSAPWCFICSKEGRLICCRYCSSSFHAECLRIEERRWRFRCPNCENGRLPRYYDIVWVKLTKQRWWPAQIPKPEEIPYDIEKLSHTDGEFCVKLFGTHGHFWVNRGRCFFFQEDDIAGKTISKDSEVFKSAVVEAGESFKKVAQLRVRLQVEKALKSELKPPPFAEIQTSRPVGSGRIFECLDPQGSMDPCKCKQTAEHPCGENSLCLNRLTLVECHRKVCKAHGKCQNQRFGKRAYPKMHPVKTPNRGWGLRCQEDIKKGTFVCEYVGEVIDTAEHQRRVEENMRNRADDYFVSLDKTRIIDAGRKGNLARFMNHSCRPNCKTEKWTVNGDTRIGIFAIEDITSGSELTFNYLFVSLAGAEKKSCLCGADNCAGFIGANVKNLKRPKVYGKSLKAEKKKKNKDICFRCEDSGELILCDSKNCPRAYHRTCLGITILPRSGPWICPWHYCDECGSAASIRCKLCPNSFCTKHAQQAKIKFYQSENGLICSEHLSDDITESTESVDLSTSVDLAENVEDFLITDIWKCSIK